MKNRIYLGLGSNIGDTMKNINLALDLLQEKVNILKKSSYYETEPVGYKEQDWFLNIVIEGETELSPEALLEFTQSIEAKMKRVKTIVNGPRIIDVDILLYSNIEMKTEKLVIPHPRMLERAFVVVPLSEIAPDIIIKGKSIEDILTTLDGEEIHKISNNMERINCILSNYEYISYLDKNKANEKDRIFCHHNIIHFLDVCRIAWIINLEEQLNLNKEIVYAVGLLHDIGRWQEYEMNISHEIASANLAENILNKCEFTEEEKSLILTAIKNHRTKKNTDDLSRIIYTADKVSRPCFNCTAIGKCKKFQNNEKPKLVY